MPVALSLHIPRHAYSVRERARAGDIWRAFQEAAVLGSSAVGWPPPRYREEDCAFVVRRMIVLHHAECTYGEPVQARTWVKDFRRGLLTTREIRLTGTGGRRLADASQASLRQFERAKVIRDTFFRSGGNLPGVRFDLTPLSMDPSADQFVLNIAGQQTSYSHGPAVPQTFEWPGQGPPEVRLQMAPPSAGAPSGITEPGDWAWFKILDESNVTPSQRPEHFNVTFSIGDRTVSYQLRAASAFNPFQLEELRTFSCPERL